MLSAEIFVINLRIKLERVLQTDVLFLFGYIEEFFPLMMFIQFHGKSKHTKKGHRNQGYLMTHSKEYWPSSDHKKEGWRASTHFWISELGLGHLMLASCGLDFTTWWKALNFILATGCSTTKCEYLTIYLNSAPFHIRFAFMPDIEVFRKINCTLKIIFFSASWSQYDTANRILFKSWKKEPVFLTLDE